MNELILAFPTVPYGSIESPWSLEPFLYKGGAKETIRKVRSLIHSGKLGQPIGERMPLLELLHDALLAKYNAGGSRYTLRGGIAKLRQFYTWCDLSNIELTVANVCKNYSDWTETIWVRTVVEKQITYKSGADITGTVGAILEYALDRPVVAPFSRMKRTARKRKSLSPKADKQILADTFAFGQFLLELCEALSLENISGRLPLLIEFSNGSSLEEWSGLQKPPTPENFQRMKPYRQKLMLDRREKWQNDTSWHTRHSLINLRIEAELLIFIAQTGMNLAQAHTLRMGDFRYASHNDGYQVRRAFKSRASRVVEFEIYSEYRIFFKKYVSWRNHFFSDIDDDRLFPLRSYKYQALAVAPNFDRVREKCGIAGISYVGPRELRKTRVNWLLRKSANPSLTAEMAQHSVRTLHKDYERPNHQQALVEITLFNTKKDTALQAPGPGVCAKKNSDKFNLSSHSLVKPDCITSAGCLFCEYQRDLPTFDHIWSLSTFHRYQTLLLAENRQPTTLNTSSHLQKIIERLKLKLDAFNHLGGEFSGWVEEARVRIDEEDYHPNWDVFIRLLGDLR
ncbi:site-specific integrase [Pseudomonas juntendi]|uniref:site-specific integrase n=1 Tax=Pseudomonas TaxID=286 RepID=UPI00244CE4F5|nr:MULTISPECIES: site-specific integrase [Pseudomonas]MDG9873769.1 site-specific integrase [Pseudomonas juntendi]MDQ2484109.1 site-specific integrase [Pseudomonas putida]